MKPKDLYSNLGMNKDLYSDAPSTPKIEQPEHVYLSVHGSAAFSLFNDFMNQDKVFDNIYRIEDCDSSSEFVIRVNYGSMTSLYTVEKTSRKLVKYTKNVLQDFSIWYKDKLLRGEFK